LVIAAQAAVAAGTPLPRLEDSGLSDTDRSRFDSLCTLIKSLHRLREPGKLDSPRSATIPFEANFLGPTGSKGSVGRFEIEGLLGHGGHGVVYLAFDPILKRQVALKIPRPEVLVDPEMRERFLREARSAAGLDHANIVPIHEAGTIGEICFIVMAYCPGGSLAEFLGERADTLSHIPSLALQAGVGKEIHGQRAGALSHRGWARTFMQLAEALDYTHDRGILHRDLKPANILLFPLTEDSSIPPRLSGDWPPFVPKLTDFGLARIVEESAARTRTSMSIGTPLYMSPEQAGLCREVVDGRSDVHAVGVVMYEALTGKPPFDGESLLSVLEAVRHHHPPAPRQLDRSIPRDLSTICMKCLEKRPSRRYQRAADLAADLKRFVDHEPIVAKRSRRIERCYLWCRRRPAVAALLAVSLLTFVGAVVGYQLHIRQIDDLNAVNRSSEYSRLVKETEELAARPSVGWSWAGFDKLRETMQHDIPDRDVVKLRSAATAFLTGTDLKQVATIAPGIRGSRIAFSPDGSQLAVGNNSDDSGEVAVEVWDFAARKRLWRLTFPVGRENMAEPDGVRSLLFTRDGRRLIAGSRHGEIHAWDLSAAPPKRRDWQPHTNWVTSLTELDNGEILSASADATIRRLNLASGEIGTALKLDGPITDLRIGTMRAVDGTQQTILAAGIGGRLRILSWPKMEILPNWRSPLLDGETLGPIIDRGAAIVARGQSIFEVDLNHAAILSTLNGGEIGRAHDGEVRTLELSPDGMLLASGGADGRVKLWDLATNTLVSNLFLSTADNIAVTFHPSGKFLVAANGLETRILEVGGSSFGSEAALQRSAICGVGYTDHGFSTVAESLSTEQNRPFRSAAHVKSFAFGNPMENRDELAESIDWRQPVSLTLHPQRPIWAAFGSGNFFDLHLEDQRHDVVANELQAISFSKDGDFVWATYAENTLEFDKAIGAVGAWRVADRSKSAEWVNRESKRQGQKNGLYALVVGTSWLAVASSDETVKLLRPEMPNPKLVSNIATEGDMAESLAFDPAETQLAVGTRRGNLILVPLPGDRKPWESQPHSALISSIAFSSDGRLLATGSYDHLVRLSLVRDGQLEPILSLPPQSGRVLKVAFGPNDDLLYVLVQNETALRTFRLKELHDALGRLHLGWR
jgi:serine/threonine protein kinase/WD40 repeat protein